MIYLNAQSLGDEAYTDDIFSANILSNRDRVDEEGTFDDKIDLLGIDHLRYPGGSLTEHYFDLSNPDKAVASHIDTGQDVELLPYSDFMSFAEENDIDVSVVIPTRDFLTDHADDNGNRYAEIDEDLLRGFIQDTLDGKYGAPTVRAFEIGNEYWGSGGMSALEYGRVSSQMAEIIQEEISNHPESDVHGDIDILVQNGQNYSHSKLDDDYAHYGDGEAQLAALNDDYGLDLSAEDYLFQNGNVAWPKVMNEIIMSEFDTQSEVDAVDGLALHIYSRGADNTTSREFDLRMVEQTWDQQFDDLEKHITEWNLKAVRSWADEEKYGLKQAHEILNMTEVFVDHGVDVAQIWAVQQNNLNNLAGNEGDDFGLTAPGEMFRMMNESLVGTRPVFFGGRDDLNEHEVTEEDTSVHGFYGEDKFVTFLASNSDDPIQTSVDFNGIVDDPGSLRIEVLGVEEGDDPTSTRGSTAEVTELDPAEVFHNGVLTVELDAFEIVRVIMDQPDYDSKFEQSVNPGSNGPDVVEPPIDETEPDPMDTGGSTKVQPSPDDPGELSPVICVIGPNEPEPSPGNDDDLLQALQFPDNLPSAPIPEEDEPISEAEDDAPDDAMSGIGGLLGFLPLLALLGGF